MIIMWIKRKKNRKWTEMRMNKSRTKVMRKRDTESKIMSDCKIKWTEMNMRMNVKTRK